MVTLGIETESCGGWLVITQEKTIRPAKPATGDNPKGAAGSGSMYFSSNRDWLSSPSTEAGSRTRIGIHEPSPVLP
jgi:hypothetical protein